MATLDELAALAGIQTSYDDVFGNRHDVPQASIVKILAALGHDATNEQAAAASLSALKQSNASPLPPVTLLDAERKITLPITHATGWRITGEDGGEWQGEIVRDHIPVPPLPPGYYRLHVTLQQGEAHSLLIASPPQCWLPDAMRPALRDKRQRVWGLAAQLYGLQSQSNWGIGDFSDLTRLVKRAAQWGAQVIGLNPLHAAFPHNPQSFSPYSPSSRLFLNLLYIDAAAVDGFAKCGQAQALWQDAAFQQKLAAARQAELVDYATVSELKTAIFAPLFHWQKSHGKPELHAAFRSDALHQHALFDALCERHGSDWRAWPEPYRNPQGEAVRQFAAQHAERVEFYAWAQSIADAQLAAAQEAAKQSGMALGLYRDLAVGSDKAGAETWAAQDAFLEGVSVGAPPDEYNPNGQNWGLPPFHPAALLKQGLSPFIALIRANMRHAGALRIDHAFGLSRLFLIPDGHGAGDGAYVSYPFDALLAVLKVESHHNRCVVIGEDLGTFPPGYKEKAAQAGVLSYKLLYFEHEADGSFTPPARYPALSLATLSTHDLPTLTGWLDSADIDEREHLGLYPSPDLLDRDRESRVRDIPLLAQALSKENLGEDITNEAVQRYLARSASAIVMTQLEDMLGVAQQVNLPGTTTERPNWRMKLAKPLESLLQDGAFEWLSASLVGERQRPLLTPPRATYRIQFHKNFTFYDAAAIVPYLAKLGVSHLYASPYMQARPGSTHGYDITDHNAFNPELGGETGFQAMAQALKAHTMQQLLDFVPNHMGIGKDNAWWMSVLALGQESPYAEYFDIDWQAGKLVVPALGDHYGDVLARGELTVKRDAVDGSYSVWYFDNRFPLDPRHIPASEAEAEAITQDHERLHALLERQHYRLAFWRVASTDINYRRFFDINELAGLRAENSALFDTMHKLALSLVARGDVQGLRIDHIDGLADPAGYCRRLREQAGSGLYLTVEKILAAHESLRDDWGIDGTSGYDALNLLGGLFVDSRHEKAFERIYRRFTGESERYEAMVYRAKTAILETSLGSELQVLSQHLKRLADSDRYSRDYPLETLKTALKEIIGWFPVYRAYVTPESVSAADMRVIEWAVARAKKTSALADCSVYDFIAALLALEEDNLGHGRLRFVRKFQQLSGPVMAKGLEDTTFYRYNRLLSLNEVGGEPSRFGISVNAFHHVNQQRAEAWPHGMIATATHDTKRGEDARARISVLSELPQAWAKWLMRWSRINRSRIASVDDRQAPSPNEEYMIYQALLGSWPVELLQAPLDADTLMGYKSRLRDYLTKALREAKINSSWAQPDEAYENAVHGFVDALLDQSKPNLFLDDFLPAARRIAQAGMIGSLSQLALKLTMPGVPDIYQGTEYWDVSLVDPDNRRPVNYQSRQAALAEDIPLRKLLQSWPDGRVKQRLMQLLLAYRANHAELFAYGAYEKLEATGALSEHIVAFARRHNEHLLVVVTPRLTATLGSGIPLGSVWQDTSLALPKSRAFTDLLTGQPQHGQTPISNLFKDFPLSVLAAAPLH